MTVWYLIFKKHQIVVAIRSVFVCEWQKAQLILKPCTAFLSNQNLGDVLLLAWVQLHSVVIRKRGSLPNDCKIAGCYRWIHQENLQGRKRGVEVEAVPSVPCSFTRKSTDFPQLPIKFVDDLLVLAVSYGFPQLQGVLKEQAGNLLSPTNSRLY